MLVLLWASKTSGVHEEFGGVFSSMDEVIKQVRTYCLVEELFLIPKGSKNVSKEYKQFIHPNTDVVFINGLNGLVFASVQPVAMDKIWSFDEK